MSETQAVAGAIDFGGTKLMVGLVDGRGAVLEHYTVPTPRELGPEGVLAEAAVQLERLLERRGLSLGDLCGIGSTVPALASSRTGMLVYAPAHGWRDVPFARMLEERFGRPARIANDVNACVLAEARFGVGQGVADFAWVTVSTGIGGGLWLDGRLLEGSGGMAGEIGHIVVEEAGALCGCGNRGCLEAMAAGPSIARRAREAGLQVADGKAVFDLARNGNVTALRVLDETAVYLARGLAACVNMVDPELVVLGGGVAESLDLLLPGIEAGLRERVILPGARKTRVVRSGLGYQAALVGAATLVLPARD